MVTVGINNILIAMEKNIGGTIGAIVLVVIAGIGGWWLGSSNAAPQTQIQSENTVKENSTKAVALSMAMNKLWEDHITWTRLYLVSAINNLPDKDAVLARLMENQEDIGNAMKTYYGDNAGNQLTALLKEHISGAGKVVEAAAKKDSAAVNSATAAWRSNGNQIADFLAQANPNWSQTEMTKMMKDHLDLTLQEAKDIIDKKHEASIADYDKVHNQILQMSAMLSSGIVKQFPDKF